MKHDQIQIKGNLITYQLKKSKRARRVRLTIKNGNLIVTIPYYLPYQLGKKFVKDNEAWIEKMQQKHSSTPRKIWQHTQQEIKIYKLQAIELVENRIQYFNQHYNFSYNKVTIRNQSTRWGSCSSQKNLNFNYRIALIPAPLADYLVVHELCHLKEMNHSQRFWNLVAETIPDYKIRRKQLQQYDLA